MHFQDVTCSGTVECAYINAIGPDTHDNDGVLIKGSITAKTVDCDVLNTDSILVNQGSVDLLADSQLIWIP